MAVRPAPRCEPPFDDEDGTDLWSPAQLTLDLPRPGPAALRGTLPPRPEAPASGPAPVPAPDAGVRAARGAGVRDGLAAGVRVARDAGVRDGLAAGVRVARDAGPAACDAGPAVRRFLHACVEVLNGYRPPAHLRHLARPAEAAEVVSEGALGLARLVALRRAGLRAGRRPSRKPIPVAILRLHLCEPRPGVVEAAAPLQIGEHTWATALRMELDQQAWAATALRLIHQGRRPER
ncbi:Rv3235 family protein [Paractinoplanes atraurantiacus]|uniref:Rv3235 family protein n=1 Tax=Paractinoplanes atraurantiacus TaxID=1036182 RepID=UPI0015CF146B|nr:Rv3235 family protein [Actinoplanes atraurantiacus]